MPPWLCRVPLALVWALLLSAEGNANQEGTAVLRPPDRSLGLVVLHQRVEKRRSQNLRWSLLVLFQ